MLVPITTDVLVGEAERLGEGGHRFTSRQLYYAACRSVEGPSASITRGFVGLGAMLIVLGGAMLWVKTIPLSAILAVIGVALLLAAPLNARLERNRELQRGLDSRALAISYPSFLAGPMAEAVRSRPAAFTALLSSSPPATPGGTEPPSAAGGTEPPVAFGVGPSGAAGGIESPAAFGVETPAAAGRTEPRGPAVSPSSPGPLVVCDRSETAELLAANSGWLPDAVDVADLATLIGHDGSELAPEVRGRPVVAIHDADPAGCGLPAALRRAGATDIVDAGLRPPVSDARLQIIEGAPARMPLGIEADLSPVEVAWLRSGRRLELATLTPRETVALVCAACPPESAGSPPCP